MLDLFWMNFTQEIHTSILNCLFLGSFGCSVYKYSSLILSCLTHFGKWEGSVYNQFKLLNWWKCSGKRKTLQTVVREWWELCFCHSHSTCLFPSAVRTKPRRPLLPAGVDSSMRHWLARLLQLWHVCVCAIPGHLQPPLAARRGLRQLWRWWPGAPEHLLHQLEPCLICVQHGCIRHLHLPAGLQAVSVVKFLSNDCTDFMLFVC